MWMQNEQVNSKEKQLMPFHNNFHVLCGTVAAFIWSYEQISIKVQNIGFDIW